MDFIFDDESCSRFLNEKRAVYDYGLWDDNETFFDSMLSKEADLRTIPEEKEIIQYLQLVGNE